jgi:hypothetical protein
MIHYNSRVFDRFWPVFGASQTHLQGSMVLAFFAAFAYDVRVQSFDSWRTIFNPPKNLDFTTQNCDFNHEKV